MPIKCFETKLKLQGGPLTLPRSYIYATRITPADTFGPFARQTKSDPAWSYHEIDASHSPNVTAPEALMALLQKIARVDSSLSARIRGVYARRIRCWSQATLLRKCEGSGVFAPNPSF